MKFFPAYCLTFALLTTLAGCESASNGSSAPPPAPVGTVLISVTSDVTENPQSIDMAMKLAGFSLDEGRDVAMFFNVKGVTIPTNSFDDTLTFADDSPIKQQLTNLIGRGVEVHVCPICMKALDVEEGDIMEGAQVTTRPKLFAHIGADTAVFTY